RPRPNSPPAPPRPRDPAGTARPTLATTPPAPPGITDRRTPGPEIPQDAVDSGHTIRSGQPAHSYAVLGAGCLRFVREAASPVGPPRRRPDRYRNAPTPDLRPHYRLESA